MKKRQNRPIFRYFSKTCQELMPENFLSPKVLPHDFQGIVDTILKFIIGIHAYILKIWVCFSQNMKYF